MNRAVRKPCCWRRRYCWVRYSLLEAVPAYSYLPGFAGPGASHPLGFQRIPRAVEPQPESQRVAGYRHSPGRGGYPSQFQLLGGGAECDYPHRARRRLQRQFSKAVPRPTSISSASFCWNADFNQGPITLAITLFTFATGSGQPDGHGGNSRFAGQLIKADILFILSVNRSAPIPSPAAAPTTCKPWPPVRSATSSAWITRGGQCRDVPLQPADSRKRWPGRRGGHLHAVSPRERRCAAPVASPARCGLPPPGAAFLAHFLPTPLLQPRVTRPAYARFHRDPDLPDGTYPLTGLPHRIPIRSRQSRWMAR